MKDMYVVVKRVVRLIVCQALIWAEDEPGILHP